MRKPEKVSTSFETRYKAGFCHRGFYFGQKIIQYRNGAGKGSITCSFAHTIDGKMYAMGAGFYAFQYIGGAQVVIIMCVKIEMQYRDSVVR